MNRVVVHYHEVALKRGNRKRFVDQLRDNIRANLRRVGLRRVRSLTGRIVINVRPEADWESIRTGLSRTFGVVNFSPAWRSDRTAAGIVATTLAAIEGKSAASFAVRVKRGDKRYPVPSMDLARQVGSAVQDHTGWRVDLDHPDLLITVEIVPRESFVLVGRYPGPGGLPVGSGGKVLALLSGGIDSPVAAVRMMRRGCEVEFVHFHGAPFQDRSSVDKALDLGRVLTTGYQSYARLHLVAFGEIQREIVAAVPRPFRVVLYRRMMLRIAEALARESGALALVTGESLGQVASQTLENMTVIGTATALPVLRPLIGMDKSEIMAEAERIGTFEISTRPDQDCCQLFLPKHPSTGVPQATALEVEAPLDIGRMIETALAGRETVELGVRVRPRRKRVTDRVHRRDAETQRSDAESAGSDDND